MHHLGLRAVVGGGSLVGLIGGLLAMLLPQSAWDGSMEQRLDYIKLILIVIIGAIVTACFVLLVWIYRRLDGTTPPELRSQIQGLSGIIVATQGEQRKLAMEFGRYHASIEDLRQAVREMKEQVAKQARLVCEDCPVLKSADDPDVAPGFRLLHPRKGGKE